jgi:hypothetical protein
MRTEISAPQAKPRKATADRPHSFWLDAVSARVDAPQESLIKNPWSKNYPAPRRVFLVCLMSASGRKQTLKSLVLAILAEGLLPTQSGPSTPFDQSAFIGL